MGSDNHKVHVDLEPGQAALLLERLEGLRGELGMLGEDLISLLRSAGVIPPTKSDLNLQKKSEND